MKNTMWPITVSGHGIREAVFGGNRKDINLVLENIVYMELLRRGCSKLIQLIVEGFPENADHVANADELLNTTI